MQEIYSHRFFRKKEKASALDDLAVQHHFTEFSRSLPSQYWLSKVLETSVAACRGAYVYLPLPEFCYS